MAIITSLACYNRVVLSRPVPSLCVCLDSKALSCKTQHCSNAKEAYIYVYTLATIASLIYLLIYSLGNFILYSLVFHCVLLLCIRREPLQHLDISTNCQRRCNWILRKKKRGETLIVLFKAKTFLELLVVVYFFVFAF